MLEQQQHRNAKLNGRADHVAGLVERLVEHASRPMEEAQALAGEFYLDRDLYELEMERIFKRDWVYAARADEIPNAGDWISTQIGDEPVVLVRAAGGAINALSRVCPHRFADVLAEAKGDRGNSQSFTCPYHSWSFAHDGALLGAPLMDRSTLFSRERDTHCLTRYQTEVFHGFVFVNLDLEAPPLAPRLSEMEELIAPYALEDWRHMGRVAWPESPVNWKLIMDNGRECYHHQGAHRNSVEPLWPAHLVDADTTDSRNWFCQRMFVSPEAAVGQEDGHYQNPLVLPSIPGLDAFQRSHYLLIGIYPNMFFAPGPDVMFIARWFPTGPATHVFELGYAVHKSQLDNSELPTILKETHAWAEEIQTEDSMMVTSIQRMITSGNAGRGGALSHLERPVWQFQKYLAHRLAGADV
ncbi:MAG: aromatic ring-hydroxylating oxygenase subunit alpha [Solirubrobacteraceae bacterium]